MGFVETLKEQLTVYGADGALFRFRRRSSAHRKSWVRVSDRSCSRREQVRFFSCSWGSLNLGVWLWGECTYSSNEMILEF